MKHFRYLCSKFNAMNKLKIGLIKEGKLPPDKRVPLTPTQCKKLKTLYPHIDVIVQSSEVRCFADNEYKNEGIEVRETVDDCDILMGVKEVPIGQLIANKTYFFFSHTIKKQPYNKKLLRAVLDKNINLIDYECLTDKNNARIIGFGRYAGIVGCYNGLRAYGMRYKTFDLKPAHQCEDQTELYSELKKVILPPQTKLFLTGDGRVGSGTLEVLNELRIKKITPTEFLSNQYNQPVFTQLDVLDYNRHKSDQQTTKHHFFAHPEEYISTFLPYTSEADICFACHFWNSKSPVFFTVDNMKSPDFRIKVIADISCDILQPIPSTIRASTIAEPLYGFDPFTGLETAFDDEKSVTVMAVDNLPCELPKDASEGFGNDLIKSVLPNLIQKDVDKVIERAMVTKQGKLTPKFTYLQDYVDGTN